MKRPRGWRWWGKWAGGLICAIVASVWVTSIWRNIFWNWRTTNRAVFVTCCARLRIHYLVHLGPRRNDETPLWPGMVAWGARQRDTIFLDQFGWAGFSFVREPYFAGAPITLTA